MADVTPLEEKLGETARRAREVAENRDGDAGGVLEKAAETKDEVGELVDWALPLQEKHLTDVRAASLELAAEEDPDSE
ncbi:MAG TPA: hypothetical protein VGH14_09270 [Solirubrobacterales bacterium]